MFRSPQTINNEVKLVLIVTWLYTRKFGLTSIIKIQAVSRQWVQFILLLLDYPHLMNNFIVDLDYGHEQRRFNINSWSTRITLHEVTIWVPAVTIKILKFFPALKLFHVPISQIKDNWKRTRFLWLQH
jgi:hypothetical protein